MIDYQTIIDKYYPVGSRLRDIYMHHCRQVADKALAIVHKHSLTLDDDTVEAAAMLHDIGIFLTDAPGIECQGTEHYLRHGILGAELLRNEHYPEEIARVAERHTGSGLTVEEIRTNAMPLPEIDLTPHTQLERLICYADKFFSKSGDMHEKTLDNVRRSMARFGLASANRFETLHNEFG